MSKDAAAGEAVLHYLNVQNRPYSAIDIFNNLHKAHGQTTVKKVLETLAADGKIVEKTYGKQKVMGSLSVDRQTDRQTENERERE